MARILKGVENKEYGKNEEVDEKKKDRVKDQDRVV